VLEDVRLARMCGHMFVRLVHVAQDLGPVEF
jgi:hypothetical protein